MTRGGPFARVAALTAIAALALAARAVGIGDVFTADGETFLAMWDASYHARRALFGFANFPALLVEDPFIAFPDGARVPMPPGWSFALAAAGRLAGSDVASFERVAAWASPALAALSVFPIEALGRRCGSASAGLGAAVIFALLPASILASGVGDADHHAAVALLGTCYALLTAHAARADLAGARRAATTLGLAVVQAAIALTWSGSLLYLLLGQAALLIGAVWTGRRSAFSGHALASLGAAGLVAIPVAALPLPTSGAFSALTLSWLHVAVLVAGGGVAAALAALEARTRAASPLVRVRRASLVCVAAAGVLLALPFARAALAPAAAFLVGADTWAGTNVEQQSLFGGAGGAGRARLLYGAIAYVIPLAMLAPLALAVWGPAARRVSCASIAVFSVPLGTLALAQVRFGSDFAPFAAVGTALLLTAVARALGRFVPRPVAGGLAVCLGAALLSPAIAAAHLPHLARARALAAAARVPARPPQTLLRFARDVRAATPETADLRDPDARPTYAILAKPSHGHTFVYNARRATAANGFGPYLDAAKYEAVQAFYAATDETRALSIADALGARYVVTWDHAGLRPEALAHLLHREDGASGLGFRRAEHFRLVTESPAGASVLRTSFPRGAPRGTIPYKLFERVTGAVLAVEASPGAEVRAQVEVETPTGRRFTYRAAATAPPDGTARLRVPYPTEATASEGAGSAKSTRALGAYAIRIGALETTARVSESDVRAGAVVRVATDP